MFYLKCHYTVNPYYPKMKILFVVLTNFHYSMLEVLIVPLYDASISFIRIIAKNQIPYLLVTMHGPELFSHEYMMRSKDTFPVYRRSSDHKIFSLSRRGQTLERFANCRKEPVMDSSHGSRPRRSQSVRRRTIDDTLSGLSNLHFL